MGKKALAREGDGFHLELDAEYETIREKLLMVAITGTYSGISDLSSRNPSGE